MCKFFRLTISWPGVIRTAGLAAADESDVAMAPEMLENVEGWFLGDRNYWSPELFGRLAKQGVAPLVPFKHETHEKIPFPAHLTRMRRRIETVISQLTERFNAKKVWAMDKWHTLSRWTRKIASHTMSVLLCRREGLPPLRFAELIDD